MRKLVLIALLVLMPFQSTWAVADAYCRHEFDAAAPHSAHQTHRCEAVDVTMNDNGDLRGHHGCASCHFTHLPVLITLAGLTTVPAGSCVFPVDRAMRFTSHIPERPLRPDRCSFHSDP